MKYIDLHVHSLFSDGTCTPAAPAIWSNIRNPQICTANRSFLMFGQVSKSSVPQFYFFEKYHIVRKESTR